MGKHTLEKESALSRKYSKNKSNPADKPLTGQQRKYVMYRLTGDYNMAQAAELAGYKGDNLSAVGSRLEALPNVTKAISEGTKERIKNAALSHVDIVNKFMEIWDRAMEAGKYNEANKAMEHIGRICGVFMSDKKQEPEVSKKKDDQGSEINPENFKSSDEESDIKNDISTFTNVLKMASDGYKGK